MLTREGFEVSWNKNVEQQKKQNKFSIAWKNKKKMAKPQNLSVKRRQPFQHERFVH